MNGWRSGVFDPYLIIAQLFAMQSLYYMVLGLWLAILCGLKGGILMWMMFDFEALQLYMWRGRLVVLAFVLTALLRFVAQCVVFCEAYCSTVRLDCF